MKLGAPIFDEYDGPKAWVEAIQRRGYGAAFCPIGVDEQKQVVEAYRAAAREAGIIIAEIGAFGPNPLAEDPQQRQQARDDMKQALQLADRIGARCCVNIAGSRGDKWNGPDAKDLTEATFEMIVESTQEIIDSVQPDEAFYTLETMPWMYPDSADSYARLIEAIDRDRFGVHLDPVNIVSSPRRYFDTAGLLEDCFGQLGPLVKSCHAKDIRLAQQLTVHLDEVPPGEGNLDYRTFLAELDALDEDVPLLIEHLSSQEEYDRAAEYIRSVADDMSIEV